MFSLKNETRFFRIILLSVLSCFFIIAVYNVIVHGNYFLLGDLKKMDNDDVKYIRSALTFIKNGMLTYKEVDKPTVFIMPGITIILSPFIKIFGLFGGLTAFRIFQAILQTLCLFLLFLIVREVLNSNVALIATLLDAFYIPEIYNVGTILTEIEFKFFLYLLIYISIIALKTKNTKIYIAGGILLGITCLIRPTILLYPSIIFIMWILYKYSFKEMLKYTIIVSSVFCIVMMPWWIRNYIDFNRFIPLTHSSGNPFLQGTYIDYDQSKNYIEYKPSNKFLNVDDLEMDFGKYRLKKLFPQKPLDYIRWYTIGKTYYMWNVPYYYKPIMGITWNKALSYHKVIIILAIIGFILILLSRRRESYLIILVIVYFNLVHLPYFTSARYSYPVMGFIITLSTYTLYWCFSRLRNIDFTGKTQGTQKM